MTHLDILDSIHISSVLDDTVDQLAVLGHIMPSSFEGRPEANEVQYMHNNGYGSKERLLYSEV